MVISKEKIRKISAIAIAAAMLASFAACGDDDEKKAPTSSSDTATVVPFEDDTASVVEFDDSEDESGTTTTATTTTTAASAATTTAKADTTTKKRDNSYKVSAKTFKSKNGKINISYPQISGLYDSAMQDYYNKIFKGDVDAYIDEKSTDSFTGEYQVTLKNADLLSIVFRCSIYMDGAAHPSSYAYAYTIDLETGCTLVPSAALDLGSAAKNLSAGNWTLSRSMDGVSKSDVLEFCNQFDEADIKGFITESDVFTVKRNAKGKYSYTGNIACRSYLDGSSTPIFIFEVNHALGDYVEIEF